MRNSVQLITYADRLGGTLAGLHEVLAGPLVGLFGGVHVLPFFRPHDGADAGFDPEDHTEVDLRLGSWDDIRALGDSLDVVVDVIVNHVSADAPQFRDVLDKGAESRYAGMFLTLGSVFPQGATEEQLLTLYRPRPGLPFTPYTVAGGLRRLVWTTFTSKQVDLDVRDPETVRYLHAVLARLAESSVAMIRLDAVGYAVKTPGTSSFMTPETFAFIDSLSEHARALGLNVLVEVHSYYQRQVEIARRVDWVYDFALPPLILHALLTGDGAALTRWLDIRPTNAVTVLDTHDGIGVVDVGADTADRSLAGLLGPEQIDALVERVHDNSGGTSRQATGSAAANVDLYQVNCTYYDALGGDDARYLLARALQFFVPGIPQVYYVGLLAGSNDMELLARTGVGRDVNRRHYTRDEVESELERPVVAALCRLIRFRNTHPAFSGRFTASTAQVADRADTSARSKLSLSWRAGDEEARLDVDLARSSYHVHFSYAGQLRTVDDCGELPY